MEELVQVLGDLLKVPNGRRVINEILENYLKELYEYNSKLPKGFAVKPIHYVKSKGKKYVYFGRYFYKYERVGGKVRWKYVGREPPKGYPPPPVNPLEGIKFVVEKDYLLVDESEVETNEILSGILKKYLKNKNVGI